MNEDVGGIQKSEQQPWTKIQTPQTDASFSSGVAARYQLHFALPETYATGYVQIQYETNWYKF